jgi:hypothetical protein
MLSFNDAIEVLEKRVKELQGEIIIEPICMIDYSHNDYSRKAIEETVKNIMGLKKINSEVSL